MISPNQINISQKYALTVNEAAQYFSIGSKKIRSLIEDYVDSGFVLQVGSKHLIKRQKFEEFLNATTSI